MQNVILLDIPENKNWNLERKEISVEIEVIASDMHSLQGRVCKYVLEGTLQK